MSNFPILELDKICNFIKGQTGIASAIAGNYPLVVTGKERKTSSTYQFEGEAVCIPLVSSAGHGKAALNYVHYQDGKFALGTILVALTAIDKNILDIKYLHLYLSKYKDILLVPLMKGSANVSLSISAIKSVKIPVPPIEHQKNIVELYSQIDIFEQQIILCKQYTEKLMQAVLTEAFTPT